MEGPSLCNPPHDSSVGTDTADSRKRRKQPADILRGLCSSLNSQRTLSENASMKLDLDRLATVLHYVSFDTFQQAMSCAIISSIAFIKVESALSRILFLILYSGILLFYLFNYESQVSAYHRSRCKNGVSNCLTMANSNTEGPPKVKATIIDAYNDPNFAFTTSSFYHYLSDHGFSILGMGKLLRMYDFVYS